MADGKPTRAERERELWQMLQTQSGYERIVAACMNILLTQHLPTGMLGSQMIELILDHEYPDA